MTPFNSNRRRLRQRRPPITTTSSPRIAALGPLELAESAPIVLTAAVARSIRHSVGALPAEHGGPLGGVRGSGVVHDFHHDLSSARTRGTYYPAVDEVNRVMREEWNPRNVNLLGFVHSHPGGATRPSRNDVEYASRIMDAIPELDRFLLPIVQSAADTGTFEIRGFAAVRDRDHVRLDSVDLLIMPEPVGTPASAPEFARVVEAYDFEVMEKARLVVVGCGGSAAFLEDMARAGLGEVVLIDPDVVEVANLATQQTYRSTVGESKVGAIARRLVDISPTIRVWTVQATLDELDDAAMRRLCVGWLAGSTNPGPTASILCAFTDAFEAQARVHRLGLHLGVPVIGGTVYAEGRGVELTFAASGLTSACIRCAQSSRYSAYLDRGYRNTVGSAGSPIMATAMLNALKIPIVLGILHTVSRSARPEHPATRRFRRLAETVIDRNLVVASLDPDVHETLGLRMFTEPGDAGPSTGTVLWRHPTPDGPAAGTAPCPDCGGTGDLSTSMGRFLSTRPMPRSFGEYRSDGPAHTASLFGLRRTATVR